MPRRTQEQKGIKRDFLPCFENLEERLLLTTLHGGEFFVYQNSSGSSVRVSLHGDATDAIELFGFDDIAFDDLAPSGVVDLVGLPNGDAGAQVTWPDGLNIVDTGDDPQWIEFSDEPAEGQSPRGSRTEIYAIYIASCSENTIITISTLEATQPTGENWTTDITQFSSSNLPVLSFLSELGGDLEYDNSPTGSGGVVIGSKRDPYIDPDNSSNDDPTRHSAVALTTDSVANVPAIGVFPGGELSAGISIAASEAYALMTVAEVGDDVQAVASDGTDAYVVDLSAYFGKIISDDSADGLGDNVQAIASDAAGNMFGVDSGDVGETSSLVSINSATGEGTTIGPLQTIAEPPTVIYRDVAGMDFDGGGVLYATAMVEDINTEDPPVVAAGLYLITIDTATGEVTRGPAIAGLGAVSSIAFDTAGTLYGLDSENQRIYTIDTVTGTATAVTGILPVSGFIGIEFVDVGGNEVLYGATNSRLYVINLASLATSTLLSDTSRTDLTSLTYDANQPGILWSSGIQNGYRLVRIGLSSTLVQSDNLGNVTNLGLVFDSANPAFGYDAVHALTFDSAGDLWGIGTLITIDPVNSPLPDPAGPFLIKIDTVTGTATRQVANTLDVADLTSMAFDSAGDLYGVNPADDSLVLIDTTNATTSLVVNLNVTDIVGIDFNAFDTLYAVTADSLYSVDFLTGSCTKVKSVGFTGLTSLSTIPADSANMYSTALIDGTYYLIIFAIGTSGVGTDVHAVASIGSDAYVVDLSAYLGKIISDNSTSGLGDDVQAIASDAAGNMFGVDSGDVGETSSLVSIDSATGRSTLIGLLQNIADPPTVIYRDVAGLDFDGGGVLYATSMVEDLNIAAPYVAAGLYLITIDTATGAVTRGPAITGLAATGSIAFDTAGTLYGVNDANRTLYTIDTVTGAATAVLGTLPVSGFVGIEFVDVGGNEVLYGVTSRRLYAINQANPSASSLLGDMARAGSTSLTFDANQPGMLWSVGLQNGYRLVRIGLSSMLVHSDNTGKVTELGLVFDSANPAFGYDAVHALTFDSADDLWGIGTLVTIDPLNSPVPDPAGTFLIKIDTVTGTATRQAVDPLDVADLTSMAFDGVGDLYGMNPADDTLVLIDTTDATTSFVVYLDITGIVGIDFDAGGDLYAVTTDSLYYVDFATGSCTKIKSVGITGMTSLSTIPDDPTSMYSTVLIDGIYHLIGIDIMPGSGGLDMGRIVIGGTFAGSLTNAGGSIGEIEMGLLWGKIDVAHNIDQVILRQGGGVVPIGEGPIFTLIHASREVEGELEPDSWIEAGGSIREVSTRSGILSSFVRAQNNPEATLPGDIIYEMEADPTGMSEAEIDAAWLAGELVDYDNNSMANAQFLTHPSGDLSLRGSLDGSSDWYALPLLAGQTVTIDGNISAFLYDSSGRMMDSLGYETEENIGIGSRGYTQKPITFTAPAADVYYLNVSTPFNSDGNYVLSIVNGTAANLGAVNVVGDYNGLLRYGLYDYDSGPEADTPNISVTNAGTLGAVVVSGNTYDTVARTFGVDLIAGDIVAYMAGRVGAPQILHTYDGIYSDGNIGRVASTTGDFAADVSAGYSDGMYNKDAFIHNISTATDLYRGSTISASGNIGVIDVGRDIEGVSITVNSDSLGEAGHVDLIDVRGDWGGGGGKGVPTLFHGPGGDIGHIYVGGTIYVVYGGWTGVAEPTVFTEGQSAILNDDGGGRLTVTPEITAGVPIPTWSYVYIGVDDASYPGLGAGGVIANLSINGTATMTTTGVVQVSELDMTGLNPGSAITIEGAGEVEIGYVHTDVDVDSFINSTGGRVISGNFGGNVSELRIAGSIGPRSGMTAAWLHGYEAAPVSGDIDIEPQYGWLHGRLNGLAITGDLDMAYIGGSLGDLRVLGKIGEVIVDFDGVTPAYDWHGVTGIVWSQTRIDSIDVGDGLADDGPAYVARAMIASTGSIGTVSISGPRYVNNNMIFGELNGSIIGRSNAIIDGVEVDAIGQVIGTDGAGCATIIAAGNLDGFQAMYSGTYHTFGSIGTVSFSGPGAEITKSEIIGTYVRTVSTSEDSNGINDTWIVSHNAPDNLDGVGRVIAGGPGMHDSVINVNGGGIGDVSGLGPDADMGGNVFAATDGMRSLTARNVYSNGWHMPGTVEQITAYGDMSNNTARIGALVRMGVAGDFTLNTFIVAGGVGTVTISGDYDNSAMRLQGPTTALLWSLTVGGNISGEIASSGGIGSIISQNGAITADISTLASGSDGDIALIQTAAGYTGSLSVGGSLKKFVSYASLGDNPADTGGVTQRFEIWGNVVSLAVGGAGNMYADLNVGGSIGTLYVGGTLYGRISTNGMLYNITVLGSLGGLLDMDGDSTPETPRGSLNIGGSIQTMSIPTGSDIFADLSVGGSIGNIGLLGGSIVGNIESRFGTIGTINVVNGDILGELKAKAINKVSITGGTISGNIITTGGSLTALAMGNSTLDADITVEGGTINYIYFVGTTLPAGRTIYASGGLGSVTISGGNIAGDFVSRRDISNFRILSGNLTGNVWAETGITNLSVYGNVQGSVIRSGGTIGTLGLYGLTNSIISSARDITRLIVLGNVDNSMVLAGFDVGPDLAIGGGDDTLHSGSIGTTTVTGQVQDSIFVAGIDPGVDGDYLAAGDNVMAAGTSNIGRTIVQGGFVGVNNGILAETSIDPIFRDTAAAAGVFIFEGVPAPAITPPYGPNVFGALTGPATTRLDMPDGLTLILAGDGVAEYDGAGNLTFEQTTARSYLKLIYDGGGAYGTTINITGADDSPLGYLVVDPDITVGNVTVDGRIGLLQVGDVAAGSAWNLPSYVAQAMLGDPSDLNVTTGDGGYWVISGNYAAGGTFTAGSLLSLGIAGNVGAPLDLGSAGTINIFGDFTSTLESWGTIGFLGVAGTLSGDVDVYCGDLLALRSDNGLSGTVDVGRRTLPDAGGNPVEYGGGKTNAVYIVTGDFGGGAATATYRTAGGIGMFTVGAGDFSGLLSTGGNLGTLTVNGEMTGRAWAAGSINVASTNDMTGAMLAASGDLLAAYVRGNMTDSYIFAGFNPGDAGFDADDGDEDANLRIDTFTPLAWRTPENADHVRSGRINNAGIAGTMTRSVISAGVGPGVDGYVGTGDDIVLGASTITAQVVVFGDIVGSANADEAYGVYSANNLPVVFYYGNQPFSSNGNARVGTYADVLAGSPTVTSTLVLTNAFVTYFNHPLNTGTVDDSVFEVIASVDNDFSTAIDNTDISGNAVISYNYNADDCFITISLNSGTWESQGVGDFFQVTLTDSLADSRGNILDGEYTDRFPSGDSVPGGDFVYSFGIGEVVLADVPGYDWWHGCAPTAAGMLVGYYDNTMYADLILGDPNDQTANPEINETIASSGDGTYTGDGTVIVSGTPGTGHIPDYALYDDYNDGSDIAPYADMSDLDPAGAHADDCLADFMRTSFSVDGTTFGGTWPSDFGPGVEDFFAYRGHTATSADLVWGMFTWNTLIAEIDAGRPVKLSVDYGGTGATNHAIIAIGYNRVTNQYACHRTWEVDDPATPVDEALFWYDFTGVAPGQDYGIGMATTINVA